VYGDELLSNSYQHVHPTLEKVEMYAKVKKKHLYHGVQLAAAVQV